MIDTLTEARYGLTDPRPGPPVGHLELLAATSRARDILADPDRPDDEARQQALAVLTGAVLTGTVAVCHRCTRELDRENPARSECRCGLADPVTVLAS